MRKIISRTVVFFYAVFFYSVSLCAEVSDTALQPLFIKHVKVMVEIADTVEKRVSGLQNRQSLDYDNGMLFIYDDLRYLNYWMKDTSIPLDLAYIDHEGMIVEIYAMHPHDQTIKRSREKVSYVLEVNQGWFADKGIGVGDYIENIDDFK